MSLVSWEEVVKSFGTKRALAGVTLSIAKGETLGILGPSGSGKSTLLRITAGLEHPTSGRVRSGGRDITVDPPHRRGFGLMFQDYCLFPHLSVARNVAFGLKMQRWDRRRCDRRTREMLELVRLEKLASRSVLTLSGGEQQRVALARSLAPSPRLLMLDEPLGALDAALRADLLAELGRILREVGATTVYVTHDRAEAMTICSRIAVLNNGLLEQAGEPAELVRRPANAFVAAFLGLGALVPGTPRRTDGIAVLRTALGDIPADREAAAGAGPAAAGPAAGWKLLVRPSAVRFASGPGLHRVSARLLGRSVEPAGVTLRVALRGRDGVEYQLSCYVPQSGEIAGATRRHGSLDAVWIDPRGCALVPAS